MKKLAKSLVASILGWQVRRLKARNNFKIVAVAGSIGKTSTKLAIAKVLSEGFRVQYQDGNYNDLVSVPLIFFGQKLPSLFNPFAWAVVFWRNQKMVSKPYPYDVVVVELGTDGPGQIRPFAKYLRADIGVLTAITPEHMEFFKNIEAVRLEEMELAKLSSTLLVNKDLCVDIDAKDLGAKTYGVNAPADVRMAKIKFEGHAANFEILIDGDKFLSAKYDTASEPQLYSICAAVAVAEQLGLSPAAIRAGIAKAQPVSGRMQFLEGVNGSTIIDDTYNANPVATLAALDTLYRLKAPQKIAILGNMNELGKYAQAEHKRVGEYCDPKELDLVVTIGPEANKYLAPAAKSQGCQVATFDNPYDAGQYVKELVQKDGAILVKGSQNRVFAEEAIKSLLANSADASKLVRQSNYWLAIKTKAFKGGTS